jgi:hypothetical protein
MKDLYTLSSVPSTLTAPYNYAPTNEQAAWFAIVYTAANINGVIGDEARETFCKLIVSKELFRGHEILDYLQEIMKVKDELEPKEIIRRAAKLINPDQAPTLFCMVTETLFAKGYLTEKEEDIINYIGNKLSLHGTTTSKIIEVIQLKNQGNCIYN